MKGEMSIPIPRDLVLEAVAQAAMLVLKESGLMRDLSEAQAVLSEVKLLKEGLLTGEQAAAMLQISLRTFKRQVAAGLWPEIRLMGSQEYRYPLSGMLAAMARKYKHAAGEDREAA